MFATVIGHVSATYSNVEIISASSPGAMITPLGPPQYRSFLVFSGTLGPVQKLYLMFPSKKLSIGVLGNAFPKYGLFSPLLSENKQYLEKTFSKTQMNNFLDENVI